jgi:hypothetical protein
VSRLAQVQINDQLAPTSARRAGLGAPAITPLVQSALNTDPSSWQGVWTTMQNEGWAQPQIDAAASKFVSTYTQIAQNSIIGENPDPGAAAASFTMVGNTIAGAVNTVEGLVSAVSSGSVPQAMNAVIGLVTSVVPAAAAAGAVSLGVGAAIVIGAALVEGLISNMFGSQPTPEGSVGNCPYYGSGGAPTILVNYAWSWGKPVPTGPSNALWRRFPDPSNSSDAGWFVSYNRNGQLDLGGDTKTWWWAAGQQNVSDEWYACLTMPQDSGKRPIDQLCYENGNSVYHHLECEAAIAKAVPQDGSPAAALAKFQQAFFAAWKANREWGLNGLPQRPDVAVLQQTLVLWNNAHGSSQTVTIKPSQDAPLGAVAPCPSPQLWSLLHQSLTPYAAILLGQSGGDMAGGVLVNGNIVLNAGPSKTRVDGTEATWSGWGANAALTGGIGSKSAPASSSSTASTVALGAAGVVGVGLLSAFLYARHKKTTTKAVLKTAWGKTGGKIHMPHHMPKLLGRKK